MILFLTSSLICFTSLLHIFWSFQNSLCSFKNSKQFLEMSFLFKGLFSNTLSCWPSVLSQQTAFPHFFFSAITPKSLQMVTAALTLKDAYSLEENL